MKRNFTSDICPPILLECKVSKTLWENLHHSQRNRVISLINALDSGTPYLALGGQKIRCNGELVRFHIGKNYRLLFRSRAETGDITLLNRQCYEKKFKRRRNAYA